VTARSGVTPTLSRSRRAPTTTVRASLTLPLRHCRPYYDITTLVLRSLFITTPLRLFWTCSKWLWHLRDLADLTTSLPFLLRSGDAHRDLATITPKTQVVVKSRPNEMGALNSVNLYTDRCYIIIPYSIRISYTLPLYKAYLGYFNNHWSFAAPFNIRITVIVENAFAFHCSMLCNMFKCVMLHTDPWRKCVALHIASL